MPLETAAGCREDGWEWECADGGDPGERRGSMDEKEDEKERKAWENAMEGYEDSLEVDKVFEKFARVAGYEGEQCIRSVPLLSQSSQEQFTDA